MAFDSKWLGDALNIQPRFDRSYSSITSDSRKAFGGSLFIALPGDKFDGHDFIQAAVASGAEAIIAESGKIPPALPANVEIFGVENTVAAYRTLASAWRTKFSIPFIAVAGSVGKTTTKELLSAVLRGRFREVVSTAGSQNGMIGIPMTILSVPLSTDVAVIEVGIDEPGTMKGHLELVAPTHSMLTAIGPEHLEKLIDLETVAREEGFALEIPAQKNATVIVRLDDPWILKISDRIPENAHVWNCALSLPPLEMEKNAGGNSKGISLLDKYIRGEYVIDREILQVTLADGSGFELVLPLPGSHNAGNLLVAVTTALALGLSPIEIQRGLSTFRAAFGRSELKMIAGNTPVLCDYYNANPTSVAAGLEVLDSVSKKHGSKRRIAVLGDMLELGPNEEAFHRGLYEKILATHVNTLLLYGERMKWLQDEMKKSPDVINVKHFSTHDELAKSIVEEVNTGDAVLIKGSRGMKMELAWEDAAKTLEPRLLAEATVTGSAQ